MSDTTLVLPEGAAPLADAELAVEPQAEPALEPDQTGAAPAFDASVYRLDIPTVDGIDAEEIILSFGGSVALDLSDTDDLAFFNSLTLGKEVELRVAGVVADKSSPLKVSKDGDKTMLRKAKISVENVWHTPPEDL